MANQPYSGPLKNPFNNLVNEDDEFGDFTSATAYPTVGTNCSLGVQFTTPNIPLAPVVPAVQNGGVFFNPIPDNTSDDEFGDFCGPAVPTQLEAPASVPVKKEHQSNVKPLQPPVKCQPNYDIDLETDLETVTHLPWNGTHDTETTIENLKINEEPDLFDITEPSNIIPTVSESVRPLEDVFALDCPIETPVLQPFANGDTIVDSLTDDEFGDFAQADVSPTQESLFAPTSCDSSVKSHEDALLSQEPVDFQTVKPITESQPPKLVSDPVVSSVTVSEAQDDFFDTGDVDPTFTAFSEAMIEPLSVCWDDPLPPLDIVDPVVVPVIVDENQSAFAEDDLFHNAAVGEQIGEEWPEEPEPEIPLEEPTHANFSNEVEEEDDFGDFADFQGAAPGQSSVETRQNEEEPFDTTVGEGEDDDFGDFEDFTAAPPVSSDPIPPADPPLTPENQIQRMLSCVFPLDSDSSTESQVNQISASPSGALWSYVSQVDSTPALSFSWKHSSAQQRFLQALRIDSILQIKKPTMNRWTPTSNRTSQPTSLTPASESLPERPNVTLDLDFFMTGAAGTPSTTANSLLESIERELLATPAATPSQPASLTAQPSLNENELSDFFDHLQLEPSAPSARQPVVDLLQ